MIRKLADKEFPFSLGLVGLTLLPPTYFVKSSSQDAQPAQVNDEDKMAGVQHHERIQLAEVT